MSHSHHQQVQFNLYHHNHSLLFQFILSEFITVHRKIKHLDHLAHHLKLAEQYPLFRDKCEQIVNELRICLNDLAGSPEVMRIFVWNLGEGLLSKFKNNCSLFFEKAAFEDKKNLNISKYAHRIWFLCLDALNIVHRIKQEPGTDYSVLLKMIEKVTVSMHNLERLIVRLLLQFQDDENVIFFLLRHQSQFDEVYGSHFVVNLFKQMYPNGVQEAGHFLLKRYAKRGFSHILPSIASKIATLVAVPV